MCMIYKICGALVMHSSICSCMVGLNKSTKSRVDFKSHWRKHHGLGAR